jgi:hypothetical protein
LPSEISGKLGVYLSMFCDCFEKAAALLLHIVTFIINLLLQNHACHRKAVK